jgi:hypothetical protein
MHDGSPERGRGAEQGDRRLGLAEIPLADGFTPDGGFSPDGQKSVTQCPVNRFKL